MDVFLYAAVWTKFKHKSLDWKKEALKKGRQPSHVGDTLIKVFPDTSMRWKGLVYLREKGEPFGEQDEFSFGRKPPIKGHQIEDDISKWVNTLNLLNLHQQTTVASFARAMFRISLEWGIAESAMNIKTENGAWRMQTPLELIDGFQKSVTHPWKIHFDFVHPEIVPRIVEIFGPGMIEDHWKTGSYMREVKDDPLFRGGDVLHLPIS